MALMVFGGSSLRILSPNAYSLSKIPLPTDAAERTMKLKGGVNSLIASNTEGHLLFYGVLDGLANGMLLWDNGSFQMVMPGGVGGSVPRTVAASYSLFSMNGSGDVLLQEDVNSGAAAVSGLKSGTLENIAGTGSPIGEGQFVWNPWLSPASLADSGMIALETVYNTTPQPNIFREGLFRSHPEHRVHLRPDG